jgi:predicted amidohydrolase YtcJ
MKKFILFNANVLTMDPLFPKAQLIVIKDGRIAEVTANERFKELNQPGTEVLDCVGKTILPGFVDAHFHLHGFMESLISLDLSSHSNVHSISDIQTRIRRESEHYPPGTWIRARGYNEFYLEERRHPNRWDLDQATSTHPVKLTHRSTRAHVLNSMALQFANIRRETPDPPDGLIDRDLSSGDPTGILFGMNDYLSKILPPLPMERMSAAMRMADENLSALGITSIHDVSSRNNVQRLNRFRRWKAQGILKTRLNVALGIEGFREYFNAPCSGGTGEDSISLHGVKVIVHETTGRLTPSQEELNRLVFEIHRSGWQAILHAIEGKTIHAACSAIEYAMEKLPKPDPRHRVEHCSVCDPGLASRLLSLGACVVTQPSFIYYNGDRYLQTVPGSHLKHLYPIGTMLADGIRVAAGSDSPLVPADPFAGIYSAVTRKTQRGASVLSGEGVSPWTAIWMYTRGASEANFEEDRMGSIGPGRFADLVILNRDPTRVPVEQLRNIKVEMTILGGEIVWKNNEKLGDDPALHAG